MKKKGPWVYGSTYPPATREGSRYFSRHQPKDSKKLYLSNRPEIILEESPIELKVYEHHIYGLNAYKALTNTTVLHSLAEPSCPAPSFILQANLWPESRWASFATWKPPRRKMPGKGIRYRSRGFRFCG